MLFATGERSNVLRLSGTHRSGEGARRARFRGRGGCRAEGASGTVGSSPSDLRLRGARRGAGLALDAACASSETAAALSPASDVAQVAAGVPESEAEDAGARAEAGARATRQVFAWRLRLEATPNRRPQLSHENAGRVAL